MKTLIFRDYVPTTYLPPTYYLPTYLPTYLASSLSNQQDLNGHLKVPPTQIAPHAYGCAEHRRDD